MSGRCEICGNKEPSNTCRDCGRSVCEDCFDRDLDLCTECSERREKGEFLEISPQSMVGLGTKMIFLGFALMFLATIFAVSLGAAEGFVMIGFFPLLLGFGNASPLLSLISLVMFLLPLILFFYPWVKSRPEREELERIVVTGRGRDTPVFPKGGEGRQERDEEQIVAVSVPEDVRKNLSIQIVGDRIIVQGGEGTGFRKSYSFARGLKPVAFSSEYVEDHELLVIRVTVRKHESPFEK